VTSKTHEKSPVIITSLSVCYELWLIVERKYIRCTALVELYTFIKSKFDKTLVCLLKSYFYLLILIWATFFVMFVFMWIQLGHHLVYLFEFSCLDSNVVCKILRLEMALWEKNKHTRESTFTIASTVPPSLPLDGTSLCLIIQDGCVSCLLVVDLTLFCKILRSKMALWENKHARESTFTIASPSVPPSLPLDGTSLCLIMTGALVVS